MHIAVIGAGFVGLATAWNLLNTFPSIRLTLFDSVGIGGGASGISAGLLHPYTGPHARLNKQGIEAMEATNQLIAIASRYATRFPIMQKGILRLALHKQQLRDFQQTAILHSNTAWLDIEECQRRAPGIVKSPALFLKEGLLVDVPAYLDGLWKACQAKGAQFIQQSISSLENLKDFDIRIFATGIETLKIPEFSHLPLIPVKGQTLIIEWPQELSTPAYPIIGGVYLLMQKNRQALIGATFEKQFDSPLPEPQLAKQELLSKAVELYPLLHSAKVIDCQAGIRASAPGHLPLLIEPYPNSWVLSGMGSKGLLYHQLFAEKLLKLLTLRI